MCIASKRCLIARLRHDKPSKNMCQYSIDFYSVAYGILLIIRASRKGNFAERNR